MVPRSLTQPLRSIRVRLLCPLITCPDTKPSAETCPAARHDSNGVPPKDSIDHEGADEQGCKYGDVDNPTTHALSYTRAHAKPLKAMTARPSFIQTLRRGPVLIARRRPSLRESPRIGRRAGNPGSRAFRSMPCCVRWQSSKRSRTETRSTPSGLG